MTKAKSSRLKPADDAEYRVVWDKLIRLRAEHKEAEQQALDFEMAHGTNRSDERDLHDEARQVLDGGGVAIAAPEKTLSELRHKTEILQQALTIQEQLFAGISRSVSAKIIDAVRPQHMALVGDIAKGLTGLKNALQAERDFRDGLQADGVSTAGLVVVVDNARPSLIPNALHVDIDAFVARFRRHGYDI